MTTGGSAVTYNLDQMVASSGASVRRIDYWTRLGILRPNAAAPGSGYSRRWTDRDLHTATVLYRLLSAGLGFDLAVKCAAASVDGNTSYSVHGVTVTWSQPC